MRNLPVLLAPFLALVTTPAAGAQWTKQSPIPTGLGMLAVAYPSPSYAVLGTSNSTWDGNVGAIWERRDGGEWIPRSIPTDFNPVHSLSFVDPLHGWAAGNENYRTTDGGLTWQLLPFLGSTYYIAFHTLDFGYVSTNGGLFVSRDGGSSWVASPNGMYDFAFRSSQVGLGVSAGGIYRTADGGQSFALVRAGNARDVVYLPNGVALAIVDGSFVHSTDDGLTWSTGSSSQGRNRLAPLSSATILAYRKQSTYNFDGQLLRSTDGGQSWTDLGTVIPDGISSVEPLDGTSAVIISTEADAWRSSNGGQTWTRTLDAPALGINTWPVDFADAQRGLLALGVGLLYETFDGGATWVEVSSGYGADLRDVDRFPSGRLIAVGRNGTVLTSDDGQKWSVEDTDRQFAFDFVAVDVVGGLEVVAADQDGRVGRSADGGKTWAFGASVPDPYYEFFAYDLHFRTLLEGWVVGTRYNFASVYRTFDGGDTWQSLPYPGLWVGIDFEGDSGWIVEDQRRLLRTTDGGQSFSTVILPSYPIGADALDVEFWDAQTGYVCGAYGYFAKSTDGGATWTLLDPDPAVPHQSDTFSDLYLLGPDDVWMSTYSDRVYHSSDGGLTWEVHDLHSAPLAFSSYSGVAAAPDGRAWTVGFGGHIYGLGGVLAGVAYCNANGSDAPPCPCGNDNDGAAGFLVVAGCANSNNLDGGGLSATGSASASASTVVLSARNLGPNQTSLFLQGNNRTAGVPFGDGLRCAGGGVVRLQVVAADAFGDASTSIDIAAKGGVLGGQTRRYQNWYRTSGITACGANFNLTNGYEILWQP